MKQQTETMKYVIADDQGYFANLQPSVTKAVAEFKKLYKNDVENETIFVHATQLVMTEKQHADILDGELLGHLSNVPDYIYEQDTLISGSRHIEIHPTEPDCDLDYNQTHEWKEIELHGNGASVIIVDQCTRCDLKRTKNTYAQCHECGQQDLETVKYHRE